MDGRSIVVRGMLAVLAGALLAGVSHAQRGIHIPPAPPPPIHIPPPIQVQPPIHVPPPPPEVRIPEPQRPVACPCYRNGVYTGSSPACCLR